MKVIAMFDYKENPLCSLNAEIKQGKIYTVKQTDCFYSNYAKREVSVYGFYETGDALWEQAIFIPLSEIEESELLEQRQNELQTI